MRVFIVVAMIACTLVSTKSLRLQAERGIRARGMALFKTNPNRRGRTLVEGSEDAKTPGTQSRWATTGSPYKGRPKRGPRPDLDFERSREDPRSSSKSANAPRPDFRGSRGAPRSPSIEKTANTPTELTTSCLPSIPGIKFGVVLERGKAKLFQDGNPLIYGGAIASIIGSEGLEAGNEVVVVDHFGNCVGRGVFNPHSQYRVRMLARFGEKALFNLPLEELLTERLKSCISLRSSLGLGVASKTSEAGHTDVFRLCNGEGDRMGGLVIDVLGRHIVIQSSAVWCEVHKEAIVAAVQESLQQNGDKLFTPKDGWKILWRQAGSRLRQDGYLGEVEEGVVEDTLEREEEKYIVSENGVLYYANPEEDGQKTGFYADQRENRRLIRSLARGKSVLDTFCYTGGFSVNAALNGASSVTCVDSSAPALDAARKNVELNGLADNDINVVKADAITFMCDEADKGNSYDIVICDPPKLAPSRSTLPRAKGKYVKINTSALSLVNDGGLLLTCTCSGAMTQQPDIFLKMIQESAKNAGVEITVLSTTHAAPDHALHASYSEGKYLTAVLCGVSRPQVQDEDVVADK